MFSPKMTTTCLIGVAVGIPCAGKRFSGWASAALDAEPVTTASAATEARAPAPSRPRRRRRVLLSTVDLSFRGGFRQSGEQCAAEVVVRPGDARQREEVAAAERGDVVGQGFVGQPGLDRFELALQVLLVADEDQAHVEVAVAVDTAVVRSGERRVGDEGV